MYNNGTKLFCMVYDDIEFFIKLLVRSIYLYRSQLYIGDKDYVNEMIEHHSMAILTCEGNLQKIQSERVKWLATNIIYTQEKEIEYEAIVAN